MSTVSVTNLKHESASGNNITLDSSGRTILGGKLAVGSGVTPVTALHAQSSSSEADRSLRLAYDGTYYSEIRQLGAAGMAFRNNNTNDLLKIDGSGRVTMPYQPCCSAYHTANKAWDSGGFSPIVWDAARYNVGNHYNTTTGNFTAPVAGKYLVTTYIHWMDDSAYTFQYLRVQVGGVNAGIELMRQGTKGAYDVFGGSQVVSAAANDAIRVVMGNFGIDAGYARGGSDFSSFEVYFLG